MKLVSERVWQPSATHPTANVDIGANEGHVVQTSLVDHKVTHCVWRGEGGEGGMGEGGRGGGKCSK